MKNSTSCIKTQEQALDRELLKLLTIEQLECLLSYMQVLLHSQNIAVGLTTLQEREKAPE